MLFPLAFSISFQHQSNASLSLKNSSFHITNRHFQRSHISISKDTLDEDSEEMPFLMDKKVFTTYPENKYHEEKPKKRCNLKCCCLYKCILFCFCPATLILSSLAYLKHNNSVLKRGTPIANYLREHGFYSNIESIEQSMDHTITRMLNEKQPHLEWISDVGFKSYSDHIVENICIEEKVEEGIRRFKERDLVYFGEGFDKKCFLNFFLPRVEKANISIHLIHRSGFSKDFFQKIEESHAVLTFYTRAENHKHDDVTQKIGVVPWGLNYDVVLRTPLASYFRYNYFGSLEKYTKKINSLFERLKKSHEQRSSLPVMKVFIDFFGNLIREECYLYYTDIESVDKMDMSKRKCTRRSYAIFTIKKKIKNYETLFFLSPNQVGQFALFEQRSKYGFLLSIPGDGLDCYRIWEALIFNNIVITKSHPLFDKFILKHNHQLPIVIVDDYVNITKENLEKWYDSYAHLTSFNNEKTQSYLKLSFWKNYMKYNRSS